MVRRALIVVCFGFMTVFMASCGQTYELQSITISPDVGYNLEGLGKSGALTVTAHYSNTKTQDVTAASKYTIGNSADPQAPAGGVVVNASGIVQNSSSIGICTWTAIPAANTATNAVFSYGTEPYTVTATYSGKTASVPINVDSLTQCYDGITYIAPAGWGSTN